MAAMTKESFFGFLFRQPSQVGKSKKAHEIALKAYKKTNGPTADLKRVYKAYLDNSAKAGDGRATKG